ncbi:unnamed protein product [Leuciscus chuanchicus]
MALHNPQLMAVGMCPRGTRVSGHTSGAFRVDRSSALCPGGSDKMCNELCKDVRVTEGGESGGSEQPGSPGNIIFNKESVLDRRPATKELISTFQKCSITFHIQWLLSECGAEFRRPSEDSGRADSVLHTSSHMSLKPRS